MHRGDEGGDSKQREAEGAGEVGSHSHRPAC